MQVCSFFAFLNYCCFLLSQNWSVSEPGNIIFKDVQKFLFSVVCNFATCLVNGYILIIQGKHKCIDVSFNQL